MRVWRSVFRWSHWVLSRAISSYIPVIWVHLRQSCRFGKEAYHLLDACEGNKHFSYEAKPDRYDSLSNFTICFSNPVPKLSSSFSAILTGSTRRGDHYLIMIRMYTAHFKRYTVYIGKPNDDVLAEAKSVSSSYVSPAASHQQTRMIPVLPPYSIRYGLGRDFADNGTD